MSTAEWTRWHCRLCDARVTTLRAAQNLERGAEITVNHSPFPNPDSTQWPHEVTFDGGARALGEHKVAGGGAAFWCHNLETGRPDLVGIGIAALPSSDSAQAAEVAGCRAGLSLLSFTACRGQRARVVGVNLGAIRYGAGTARYRRLPLCQQMETGLRSAEDAGWTLTWQAVRR
eukprot:7079737-Pyramimonas_sp.AAC.1